MSLSSIAQLPVSQPGQIKASQLVIIHSAVHVGQGHRSSTCPNGVLWTAILLIAFGTASALLNADMITARIECAIYGPGIWGGGLVSDSC